MAQRVGIIGARGFLGGNLRQAYAARPDADVIEIDARGSNGRLAYPKFDRVYFCAGNARTYVSAQRPQECLQRSVTDLIGYLTGLSFRTFVLISSWLVYPADEPVKQESLPIDIARLSPYGAHKYLAECYVRRYAPSHVIFRPTGFFGPGMKKGLLYDLKHRASVYRVSPDSYEDAMEIGRFCRLAIELSERLSQATLNVGSGFPIATRELLALAPQGSQLQMPERSIDCRTLSLRELHRHARVYATEAEQREELFRFLQWQPALATPPLRHGLQPWATW